MKLADVQLEKYADVLMWGLETARSKPFKAYDNILVRFESDAAPLAEKVHRKLIERRMNPVMRCMPTPIIERDFLFYSDKKQRTLIGRWETLFMENLNGNIFLSAPASLTHLKDIDPKRMNEIAVARKKLRDILQRREERGLFGWTLCTMPTPELARQAGISGSKYTEQIVKACFLDEADPVKKWKEVHAKTEMIKKWLGSLPVDTLRLESKGCDLTVNPGEKRRYLGVSGHNIPSFEIFTSPDWRGAKGVYYANLPSFRGGNYIKDVKLEFVKGEVVKADASEGADYLNKMLAMDAGAKRIGEFSLTDRRFSKIDRFMADTLFDENFGGTNGNAHIAVGMAYTDTYRGNPAALGKPEKKALGFNDSALHWDLVNTEKKRVSAKLKNGSTITVYENGEFKY
jgi:aminopeptidase